MHELLREYAELIGRCLARRWLREQETLKSNGSNECADTKDNSSGASSDNGAQTAEHEVGTDVSDQRDSDRKRDR